MPPPGVVPGFPVAPAGVPFDPLSAVGSFLSGMAGLGAAPAGPALSGSGPVTVSVGGMNLPPEVFRMDATARAPLVDLSGESWPSKLLLGVAVVLVATLVLQAVRRKR